MAAGIDLFDSSYPLLLTMGGLAMTFPLDDDLTGKGSTTEDDLAARGLTDHESGIGGEGLALGTDSSKINLLAVACR